MDERDFNEAAEAMLARIEQALESCGVELDYEFKAGSVLELEFDDGSKIIVNRHSAAREIWLAAKSGGYHFRLAGGEPDGRWVGTRDGRELLEVLARCIGEQGGRAVTLG